MFYYSHIRRPSIRSYRVLFILTPSAGSICILRNQYVIVKVRAFREFCFCSVAAKFAGFHAPTRFFGQRSFAIFNASVVVSVQSDCVSLLVTVSSLQHALFMGSCHFCGASLRAGSLFRVGEKVWRRSRHNVRRMGRAQNSVRRLLWST